jgi:hypothetical protein
MAIKYINIFLIQGPPKFTQIGILVLIIWQPCCGSGRFSPMPFFLPARSDAFSRIALRPQIKLLGGQGDRMSLSKNRPKCSPSRCGSNKHTRSLIRGKNVCSSVIKKMPKVNNRPIGEISPNSKKFAQSGHTVDGSIQCWPRPRHLFSIPES